MAQPHLTLAEVSRQHKVWIIDPIGRCVQYIADESLLGGLMHRAVSTFEHFDVHLKLARKELLRHGRRKELAAVDSLLAQHPFLAKLAREHVASDFATLNAHGLVAIWAALESCIEETAVLILMNDSAARARMFTDAGTPRRLDPNNDDEETCRTLIQRWEQAQPRAASIGHRFERLLAFFDLGTTLDDALAIPLAEINAIRNCLMHRRGVIDERAVQEAPGLAARLHQPIVIKREEFLRYHKVVGDYAVSLMGRITKSKYSRPAA
jgi:hypothetical protein